MAERGARVFIIARQGRPSGELPEGIHFTHTAIGVYSMVTADDGRQLPGYVIHNLYQRSGSPDVSDLVMDHPVEFFAGVHALKAGIIIPTPEVQRRLLAVVNSATYRELHNPRYSVIANPFNELYQNCTEHTLDVLNAAVYRTADKQRLKAISAAYFEPQEVRVNPFKLILGSLFVDDVSTSDHDGPVRTSTFSTIRDYMQEYGLVDAALTLTPN